MSPSIVWAWSLNDVSVLIPLPPAQQIQLLLNPQDHSEQGELLPVAIYENLPSIVQGADPKKIYTDKLKVVAFRIDPCFLERGTPYGCRRQIRLVWQPVSQSGDRSFTMDAALHTFYDLSAEQWGLLLEQLAPLQSKKENDSLNVHPQLVAEGLSGPTWSQFKKIILNFAGSRNLSRVTAMTVNTFNSIWTFTGFDVNQGVLSRIKIPRVDRPTQAFFLDFVDLLEFRASISPYPQGVPDWLNLVTDSLGTKQLATEEQLRSALDQALRIENPKLEDTASIDCVSCHIAQTARLWGERNTKWSWAKHFASSYYQSSINLKNNSRTPESVNRLRAFGYFMDEAIVSQRIINESAEVVLNLRASQKSSSQGVNQ